MAQGVGIEDIYGIAEQVEIRPGFHLTFHGWGSRRVAELMQRYPVIGDTLLGVPLTIGKLKTVDPFVVGAMLAAGMRKQTIASYFDGKDLTPEQQVKEMEEVLADLPLQTQMDCIKAIRKVTWPKGSRPFLEELFEQPPRPTSNGSGEPVSEAQDTSSPRPSSNSEDIETESTDQSGISPPAN